MQWIELCGCNWIIQLVNLQFAKNILIFREIGKCFEELDGKNDCRAIVLSAAGRLFTAGICSDFDETSVIIVLFSAGLDFQDAMNLGTELAEHTDPARKARQIYKFITLYQKSITSLELCKKPVLAAVHSACVGGGINLVAAADMRYCTQDAWFQVKEVRTF